MTAQCLGKQVHAAWKIFALQQIMFFVSVEFYRDRKAVTNMR